MKHFQSKRINSISRFFSGDSKSIESARFLPPQTGSRKSSFPTISKILPPKYNTSYTQYGPPTRSANSGMTVTVFGAYGSSGRYIVNELGACGTTVYVPFRGCELEVRHLKPMFALGQLGLMPFSPRDDESIKAALKNSDVVINMIGKHYETKHIVPTRRANGKLCRVNYDLHEVHVEIPRKIAKFAKEAGVNSLIHISALSADIESSSVWSRTKAMGEQAVRSEFKRSIIVKPATTFGPEDRFLNWIAEMADKLPFMPIVNQGKTLVQPVYSVDVGKALMALVYQQERFAGTTVQLAGPAEYTYKEIYEFVTDITGKKKPIVDIPVSFAKFSGRLLEQSINPVLTEDMVAQLMEDVLPADESSNYKSFADLDITPSSMDKVSFDFLHRFRPGGHFTSVQGYY